jgi:hypothetical protein
LESHHIPAFSYTNNLNDKIFQGQLPLGKNRGDNLDAILLEGGALSNIDDAFYTTSTLGALFGIGSPIKKNAAKSNAAILIFVTPAAVSLDNKILLEAGKKM